jgi:hypothetical protein
MQAKATRCIIPVAPSRETELCAQDGPARVKIALAPLKTNPIALVLVFM